MSRAAAPRPVARIAPMLVLAYLGFVSLGLPDGLLGVAWPSMRADFGVPVGAVGFVLTLGTTGYLVSSVSAGFLLGRVGVGWLLAGSTALVGLALAGYGLAPVLGVVVGCALLLGLGSGAIDSGLNAYAAAHFGARHMNWLHAFFGLGATLGPLVMTGVLTAGLAWRWGYGLVAVAQAALSVAFVLTVRAWKEGSPAPAPGSPATASGSPPPASGSPATAPAERVAAAVRQRRTWAMPVVWLGVLLFGFYTGIEVGTGLWAYSLLTEARGVAGGVAGVCVSAYWGSLFVGRVLYGVVAERVRSGPVVLACMVVMTAGAGLLALPAPGWVAVTGLILIGGFAAPVFPLMTLTTADRVGDAHADRAIGMQMGAAGLGAAVIPAGVGVVLGRFGPDALGAVLALLAAIMVAVYLAIPDHRHPPPKPASCSRRPTASSKPRPSATRSPGGWDSSCG
jgi:fucose permease